MNRIAIRVFIRNLYYCESYFFYGYEQKKAELIDKINKTFKSKQIVAVRTHHLGWD